MLLRVLRSCLEKHRIEVSLTVCLAMLTQPEAMGLTINSNFIPRGGNLPGIGIALRPAPNTSGSGNLQEIFQVAAQTWERVIQDDFTITLNYGWYPTSPISSSAFHQGVRVGGSPSRQLEGSIAFNNNNANLFKFFLDGTPYSDEEFSEVFESELDLGGGLIGTRRHYWPIGAEVVGTIDLLSTAIHEIGHALGLVGWQFFNDEVTDGDIDITIAPYTGTSLPVAATHLDISGPMMSNRGRPLGSRRDITQADLLAVCQLSRFTDCVLESTADFDTDNDIDGTDFLAWQGGFGRGIALAAGDADADLDVDGNDLTIWKQQYGGLPVTSTALRIPEPSTHIALIVGILSLLTGQRRAIQKRGILQAGTHRRWNRSAAQAIVDA